MTGARIYLRPGRRITPSPHSIRMRTITTETTSEQRGNADYQAGAIARMDGKRRDPLRSSAWPRGWDDVEHGVGTASVTAPG